MSGEAFARLLAGTLYEYDNTAPPTPIASPPARWRPESRSIPQRPSAHSDLDETLAMLQTAMEDVRDANTANSASASRSVNGSLDMASALTSARGASTSA